MGTEVQSYLRTSEGDASAGRNRRVSENLLNQTTRVLKIPNDYGRRQAFNDNLRLAKRLLCSNERLELRGLGLAVAAVVNVAEVLKYLGVATIIGTSYAFKNVSLPLEAFNPSLVNSNRAHSVPF